MPSRVLREVLLPAALLVAALGGLGCGVSEQANLSAGGGPDRDRDAELRSASLDLANRDIRSARQTYSELFRGRDTPRAAAGKAITDLFLLPESDRVVSLFRNHLGARGTVDAQSILYEEGGYLYWLRKGATWTGRGDSAGIRDVIADRLPWDRSRLESFDAFAEGLDTPLGEARGDVLGVAERLGTIQDHIRTAVRSESFERFVVPGETFRDVQLTMKLGRSEMALLGAVVATSRGLLRYAAAYEYDWNLEEAFSRPCETFDGDPAPDWRTWDCTLKFLDRRWFRSVADESQLGEARQRFDEALGFLQRAIDLGLERRDEQRDLALEWSEVDAEYAEHWRDLIGDVRTALEKLQTLRFTSHPTREGPVEANFSSLFDPGRTLDVELDWLVRSGRSTSDEPPDWIVADRALQAYFVEGIFEPAFDLTQGQNPELSRELTGDGEGLGPEFEALTADTSENIERSYLLDR